MIPAFRIVKAKYANTAFDGEGAKLAGGRWNHEGSAIVYVSASLSLAALELFVHLEGLPKMELVSIKINIPKNLNMEVLTHIPNNWNLSPAPTSTKDCGDKWLKRGRSPVLQVPSIIIPNEYNFLLNPQHADFKKIKIEEPTPFHFDFRMWKVLG